jgi:hypothetical protein
LRVDVLSATLLNTPTPAVEFLFMSNDVDKILEKLAKDVELAVHALYRGEARSETTKVRTGHLVQGAKDALSSPRPSVSAPAIAGESLGWTRDESDAVLRCINAWQPIAGPSSTAPDTKCIAAGKMLLPSWAERTTALDAVRRISAR